MKHAWLLQVLTAVAASSAMPVQAETRALLLGVSHYGSPSIPDLVGPANDIAAMDALVRNIGAADVVRLEDGKVTRSSVESALQALGGRAKPGDWLLLYYSGHGAQAVARKATARDGKFDQFLPLAGFDPDHQDPERFIVDKDFYSWLKRYVSSSVNILMLVDSCHSGTMHRAIDTRAFGFTPRLAFRDQERAFELVARPGPKLPGLASTTASTEAAREDLPNLIYIGASRDDQLALEVALPRAGAPSRGVLTYAFQSALSWSAQDGSAPVADIDGDGRVSVLELSSYLNSQVRLITAQRQESSAHFPAEWSDRPVLSALPPVVRIPEESLSAVAMFRGAPPDVPAAARWRLVASAGDADFMWDRDNGDVMRRSGDVVATGVKDTAALGGVAAKWRIVDGLLPFVSELGVRLVINPDGGDLVYPDHAKVSFAVTQANPRKRAVPSYATVLNLSSDSAVQLLYPLATDGAGMLREDGQTVVFDTQVVPPFGTDHVVAIITTTPPEALRAALRALDGQRASDDLKTLIIGEIRKAKGAASLSIVELYTGD